MSCRHLELLRDLSARNREKEEQQRREEQRLRKRQTLLTERILGHPRACSLPPPESSPLAQPPVPQLDPEAPVGERRQWRARVNEDVERRGLEAIRKVQEDRQKRKMRLEREELKKQWRAHKAQSYLVENCTKPELKEFLESKSKKPCPLPKLPLAPLSGKAASWDGDVGAESGKVVEEPVTTACGQDLDRTPADCSPEKEKEKDRDKAQDKPQDKLAVPAGAGSQPRGVSSFLNRLRLTRMRASCSSLSEWKQRNGAAQDQKVFVCVGGYPDFREALLRRGWFQNEDKDSKHFDLKWAMASNMDHDNLQDFQIANHYDRNREITTKVGLTRNLRQAPWHCGVDADNFYPRAFDLYDPLERADFVLNFKHSKAEAILRGFLEDLDSGAAQTFGRDVVATALKICMRLITDPQELMDCAPMAEDLGSVPAAEWDLLAQVSLDNVTQRVEGSLTTEELQAFIRKRTTRETGDEKKKREADVAAAAVGKKQPGGKEKKRKRKKKETSEDLLELSAATSSFTDARALHMISNVRSTLAEMMQQSRQHFINGRRNAWIVKPSGKSRGRGIQVMRELDEIFKTTESDGFQWIIQKYIETPHLVHGYKFDIRQWVLVTDWNPLTVYIWRQPYLRFAGQKYDATMSDRSGFKHLTNNSIMHDMEGFKDKNEDLGAYGYMWFRQQYQEYLHKEFCKCEACHTPWLAEPPYTCDYFGVRWEDVMFVAREEDDEDDEDGEDDCGSGGPKLCARAAVQGSKSSSSSSDSSGSTAVPSSDEALSEGGGSTSSTSSPREGRRGAIAPPGVGCEALDEGEAKAQVKGASGLEQKDATATVLADPSGAGAAVEGCGPAAKPGSSSLPSVSPRAGCCGRGPPPPDDGREPCQDIWGTVLEEQMKEAIINSLACVQDEVRHRKNNFEMFGYDFMVSAGPEGPQSWLIEVNSSPACDYSTPVTVPLVKKVMEDCAKVMVDVRENPEADTGEWELLRHRFDKFVSQRIASGVQLAVVGKEMLPPKGFARKKKSKKKKKKCGFSVASLEEDEDEEDDDEEDGADIE